MRIHKIKNRNILGYCLISTKTHREFFKICIDAATRKFNDHNIRKLQLGPLVFTVYFNFGVSIVEVKTEIQTTFTALFSKNIRIWRLKK